MDDSILIEPDIGVRPWLSVMCETCTKKALGPGTINEVKDEVEGALEATKLIWGLMYNTAEHTRSLPAAKLEKASYLLRLPEFDFGNTNVPLKLVQELRGNQQFWLTVMPALRPLLSATNALLGPPTPEGMAKLRGTLEEGFGKRSNRNASWWTIDPKWSVRFTHPLVEALTVRELLALPGGRERIIWASGDATLERVGAVDWSNKEAYALRVDQYQATLEAMAAQATDDLLGPRRVSRPEPNA